MNYAGGRFEADVLGSHSNASFDFVPVPHQVHAEKITIPDAHLLFAGHFERSGNDLIISDREHRFVVNDYFHGDKRPVLISPDGAPLDIKVVEALTGHTAYAQAGTPPAPKVVGHVVKLTGSASVVRNGVTVEVNVGDNLYQNDVVQTGSTSTLGLVLDDGSTFNLSANTRFMLNDLVYEANSTSNSSLMTLIQGAASFVAGQVAPTGDMKVATPISVIGIRGTAVILDISSTDGAVSISVVDQQDNQVHTVQVYNTQGTLIGTVASNGSALKLTPVAGLNAIAQDTNKSPDQIAQEFSVFQQVLSTYDAAKQILPNLPQHTENKTQPDTNPTSTAAASSTPILPSEPPTTTVFIANVTNNVQGSSSGSISQIGTVSAGSVTVSGNTTSSQSSLSDINQLLLTRLRHSRLLRSPT